MVLIEMLRHIDYLTGIGQNQNMNAIFEDQK